MRAVLCGYYGMGNGGDEALLASLLQMLPDQVTPVVLSGNPDLTRDRYGVEAVNRKDWQAIWFSLRKSQVFIWGGGSLMQDSTSLASAAYYAGLMKLAQWMGLTTIAWAQGIGPLNRAITRWIARQTFAGCTAISVRDPGSMALLNSWGLKGLLAPDPVWAMAARSVNIEALPPPRIAVNLRRHPLLTGPRLETLIQALRQLQATTQASILLLPFQQSQDLAIAQLVQSRLLGSSQILSYNDPQELKGVFRQVKMLISMRLHGLIMAAAEGCQCTALSYDPKVSQLMQQAAIPGWELAALPNEAVVISQEWLAQYRQQVPPPHTIRSSMIHQARLHQQLLHQVLAKTLA
ncbi:MAG: polysaccharide pyruvyl transferase CsaB [Leptolyngbyaceae cyanobacterium]